MRTRTPEAVIFYVPVNECRAAFQGKRRRPGERRYLSEAGWRRASARIFRRLSVWLRLGHIQRGTSRKTAFGGLLPTRPREAVGQYIKLSRALLQALNNPLFL